MNISTKLLQAAAGQAGGAGLDVDEVFQTTLWTGNASTQTITTGIDLSGEGGLLWLKQRTSGSNEHHWWLDSERTAQYTLSSNLNSAQINQTSNAPTFTSTGFSLYNWHYANDNNEDYVGWTFRKAPKFFDVVTYSGSSSAQTISHSLDAVPAVIIVKQLNSSGRWTVYHKDASPTGNPQNGRLALNTTDQWYEYPAISSFANLWNQTAPTSTHFTVGTDATTGASGSTYVAYLFAHNNSDGTFGPSGDQDIIKCDSISHTNGSDTTVNLGFEPQWLMVKCSSTSGNWFLVDNMRGITTGGNDARLYADSNGAESEANSFDLTSSGFILKSGFDTHTYIYMAIRRGPLAAPTDATKVFAIDQPGQTSPTPPRQTSGFPVDFFFWKAHTGTQTWRLFDRLRGKVMLAPNSTAAEVGNTYAGYAQDQSLGIGSSSDSATDEIMYMWKRAPSYFDVVAYTGTGSGSKTINHNLGVVPEMMWVKSRGEAKNWRVYHKDLDATAPEDKYLKLNTTDAVADSTGTWNDTAPTATQFTVGNSGDTNNAQPYIAYLFATVAGVSKVGSYTGNGSSQNIDCGFSSGARFVLLKRTDSTEDWTVFDSVRGITTGSTDKGLNLNLSDAQFTESFFYSNNVIQPHSSGFTVLNHFATNGRTYIFYAIA